MKILGGEGPGGFSPKAEYIFRKQIEEADFVIVNRIDELDLANVRLLGSLIEQQYPGRPVIRMSAKTGEGFEAFIEFAEQQGQFGTRVMDVDYDLYAEGEAELGWLNSQLRIASENAIDMDQLLIRLVRSLQTRLGAEDAEIAHLKSIGMADGNYAVANSVSSFTEPEISLASGCTSNQMDVVVNARVATAPERLEELVRGEIQAVSEQFGASAIIDTMQSFRPGRPVPTHRLLS